MRMMQASIATVGGLVAAIGLVAAAGGAPQVSRGVLLHPDDPELQRRAPDVCRVNLETSKGRIVLDMRREWSPHGVDRFYNLVRAGFYDDARIFRIRAGFWAQFGINGDPEIARAWRSRTI